MKMRRYSSAEIAAKLRQAEELVSQGKLQSEVAQILGISVMTYHRWRKAVNEAPDPATSVRPDAADHGASDRGSPADSTDDYRISEFRQQSRLRQENTRLRRLVADLLLEKVALEEMISADTGSQRHSGTRFAELLREKVKLEEMISVEAGRQHHSGKR